jgi:LytS/YehU family sensor histidine kinase
MLEGLDSKWNYTFSNNLQYTTLPPGAYTFKVYALNGDGVKSLKPALFYFVISKPFWKEWWFISLVLVLLTSSIIGAVTYRIELLKRRAVEKSEVNRKMADLKLMALRAQMNPHFIFNSINSIQLFILKNDSESAHKHLSRFSRLIRNVLENSKHEYISLAVEIETLEHYIELERLRFSSKFDYKITVDEELDVKSILISPLLIQPYVENAIWHGLMHLKDRAGELLLCIEKEGQLLKCTIEDNGIGRKRSAEYKKGKDHQSTGLSLNKERVEIINTLHNSSAGLQFIDKQDKDGLPAGTKVVIYMPININYSEYA